MPPALRVLLFALPIALGVSLLVLVRAKKLVDLERDADRTRAQLEHAAKLASEKSGLPCVLISALPANLNKAAEALQGKRPLLYITDPEQAVAAAKVAKENGCPLAVKADGLDALAEDLGIELLPGIVVDATTQLFGIQNPDFALVIEYPSHTITRELNIMTLFPRAAALELNDSGDWSGRPLLTTLARAWTETGELVDEISFDEGSDERVGPLDIGIVLSRNHEQENGDDNHESVEQRVVVLGDGDFISNTYAGNGGNVELGLNIIDWLSHDDEFIAIRPKAAPDQNLSLSHTAQVVIGIGFLFALPLLLLFAGLIIWLRRRKR